MIRKAILYKVKSCMSSPIRSPHQSLVDHTIKHLFVEHMAMSQYKI